MTVTIKHPKIGNESKERMTLAAEIRKQKWARSLFVKITSSLACAVVLEQILYWHMADKNGKSKLRVTYQGDYWMVKPREDMMLETGTSLKQYQSAIAKLKAMGIIEYRIGGFQGKPTPYIKLDIKVLECLINNLSPKPIEPVAVFAPKSDEPLLPFSPKVCAKTAQSNTDTMTYSLTDIGSPLAHPAGRASHPTIKLKIGGAEPISVATKSEKKMASKSPTTSAQILKQIQANKVGTVPGKAKPNTSGSAQEIWRRLVSKHHPSVGMLPELTAEQRGKFSHIARIVGYHTDRVLTYCIIHWVGFTKHVANQAGLSKTPETPNIGFLLVHIGAARTFATQSGPVQLIAPKPKVKSPVASKPHKEPTPTTTGSGNETDGVASLADIMSWKASKG